MPEEEIRRNALKQTKIHLQPVYGQKLTGKPSMLDYVKELPESIARVTGGKKLVSLLAHPKELPEKIAKTTAGFTSLAPRLLLSLGATIAKKKGLPAPKDSFTAAQNLLTRYVVGEEPIDAYNARPQEVVDTARIVASVVGNKDPKDVEWDEMIVPTVFGSLGLGLITAAEAEISIGGEGKSARALLRKSLNELKALRATGEIDSKIIGRVLSEVADALKSVRGNLEGIGKSVDDFIESGEKALALRVKGKVVSTTIEPTIKPLLTADKPATIFKELEPLAKEARNYKSAEEFVRARGIRTTVEFSDLPKSVKEDIGANLFDETNPKFNMAVRFGADDISAGLEGIKIQKGFESVDDLLKQFKLQDRGTSSKAVANLKNEIAKGGKGYELEPIIVNGSELIDGGHRIQAYKELGRKQIPVIDIANIYKELKAKPASVLDPYEYGLKSFNKTTSQLTDFYNQSVKQPVPKPLNQAVKGADDLTPSISKAKASGQSFESWVKGQGELPIARDSKIVWQMNKEGGQKIGNTQILRKPTLEDFKKEILPRTREGYYGTGSIESQYKNMLQKEPNVTISFKDKGKGWEVSKIDDLINIQKEIQAGINQGWAKVVDDFESPIAKTIRTSADSEVKFPIKTRSELKAEWEAIKQPAPSPLAPTGVKEAEEIVKQATIPEAKFTKRGLLQPTTAAEKQTLSDKQLLGLRFRQQATGARIGFKTGGELARAEMFNKQANKLEKAVRAEQLKSLKQGIQLRIKKENLIGNLKNKAIDAKQSRGEVVTYIKENLSLKERGKFITMTTNAKDKKDVARAFIRVDARVNQVKLDEGIKKLKASVDKLKDSSSISADYQTKIKDIVAEYELSGHSAKTIEKLRATAAFIKRVAAQGIDVKMSKRVLNKLKILGRTPKKNITLSQIQGLQQELELTAKLGKTKLKAKKAIYEYEKEIRKENLLGTVSGMDSFQPPPRLIGENPRKWMERYIKTRNYLKRSKVGLTPIDGLAEITGMKPMKADLDLDFGNYLTHNDKALAEWQTLTKKLNSSNFERIGTIALARQEGGLERLANKNITPEQVKDIVLTPQEEAAYSFVRKAFEEQYPSVKQYMLDVYNVDVGKVENYVSFMGDYDAMNDLEMYDRFGNRAYDVAKRFTKKVEEGFTKARARASPIKLELDIDKIFKRHLDDVAYMVNMGRDTKMYFEIVNSYEMRAKLGDVGALAWLQWLDLMARKGGSEGAKRIAALDILRKNLSVGVLGFRLSSALVQLSSFADAAATIGAEWASKGAYSIATSKEWRNFIMDNFPEIRKAMGDDIAFRELKDVFFAKATKVGMMPLQILDGLMRSVSAAGTYQKLGAERGIAIDFNNPNKELIQEATRLMRESQGSSFFKDQPLSLTTGFGITDNKSFNKTIFTFQSFMLNRWDNINRQIWRLGIKEKNYKKAATSFLLLIAVAAALEEGLRMTAKGAISLVASIFGDDEQDKDRMSFEKAMVLNAIQSVPIAGQIVSSMTYATNPVPIINAIDDAVSGASQTIKGKALQTKIKGGVRASGAVGSLFGVPGASQGAQIIRQSIPSKKLRDILPQEQKSKIRTGASSNLPSLKMKDILGEGINLKLPSFTMEDIIEGAR